MKANQTSFKKGQSGNLLGRPKRGQSLSELMREYLEQVPEGQKLSRKESFVHIIYRKAVEDEDFACIKLIWSYLDGLPQQRLEVNNNLPVDMIRIYRPEKKYE